jgi:Sigma-70 region 2
MEVNALPRECVTGVHAVDPDADLVAAARAQPSEFLALYDRYFARVLGYVRVRIRDGTTCEDITSHVFTTALAEIGRFRGQGPFAGWLFRSRGMRCTTRSVNAPPSREPSAASRPTPPPKNGSSSASEPKSSAR